MSAECEGGVLNGVGERMFLRCVVRAGARLRDARREGRKVAQDALSADSNRNRLARWRHRLGRP